MRWRWWRPGPEPDGPAGWPGPPSRLPDPMFRPEPAEHGGVWVDLLPGHQADDTGREALTEPTQLIARPLTPAQRMRGEGGGWHQ